MCHIGIEYEYKYYNTQNKSKHTIKKTETKTMDLDDDLSEDEDLLQNVNTKIVVQYLIKSVIHTRKTNKDLKKFENMFNILSKLSKHFRIFGSCVTPLCVFASDLDVGIYVNSLKNMKFHNPKLSFIP